MSLFLCDFVLLLPFLGIGERDAVGDLTDFKVTIGVRWELNDPGRIQNRDCHSVCAGPI